MRSQWIRAGLTERDLETDIRRESSREDGGRGLEGRVYKPGVPGHSAATSHLMGHLMLGEAGRTCPLSLQREHGSASAWVSDSGLQAVRECVCCFKPPFW